MTFRDDTAFAERFLDHMRAIAGRYLIRVAPVDEDVHRATDLIVLQLDALRIACRVRRERYLAKYGQQFTIRFERRSGTKTEFAKIIFEGWGDYLLYGFGPERGGSYLTAWALCDLAHFRSHWAPRLRAQPDLRPGTLVPNGDGTEGRAFWYRQYPAEFVVASHGVRL